MAPDERRRPASRKALFLTLCFVFLIYRRFHLHLQEQIGR